MQLILSKHQIFEQVNHFVKSVEKETDVASITISKK